MISIDTNILLYALNADAPAHHAARAFLEARTDDDACVVSELVLVELFAVVMDRKDRFWLWFQVGNWMTIPATVIGAPLVAIAASGHYPRADMDHILSLFLYYGMIVSGCVTFRSLKIGWEMAGFFACMSIFIGQQIWNLMFWLNGYSAP